MLTLGKASQLSKNVTIGSVGVPSFVILDKRSGPKQGGRRAYPQSSCDI